MMLRHLLKRKRNRVAEGSGTAKSMPENMEILHRKEIKQINLSKEVSRGTDHSLEYWQEDGVWQ